ncbi:MAG: hypothetical protein FWG98_06425 [Candidatus Cloacimonetes bacterium]|nr:hypothetical protein [Candidatus Cloacimonadota bacterium]
MRMSKNQRPVNSRQLKLAVLLALCLSLILFVGCSSKEKTDEATLEFIIRFEDVIAYSNENFEGADVRLKLITKTPGGEISHLFSDMSKGEQTWKINKNSPFFGISVEVLNTENTEFDDWVSFGEKFFFNTNHNPEVIDGYFRWHLPFSFTELNSIIIVVLDQIFDAENDDRQYIIFVNDEEIDIEDLIVLGAGKPNRPSNMIEDTRPYYQESNFVISGSVPALMDLIPTNGNLYEFNISDSYNGSTHNETFGHIEGFALCREYFMFTHSDTRLKNPRIYRYNTETDGVYGHNTADRFPDHYEMLGSIQVVGDYLAMSYGMDPRRIVKFRSSTLTINSIIAERNLDTNGKNTSVGVVALPGNVKYSHLDDHGPATSKKYALIMAGGDHQTFRVFICPTGDFENFTYYFSFQSNWVDSRYENIQLFVDDNHDIWMFGFIRQNDYTTSLRAYKLTHNHGNDNLTKDFITVASERETRTLIAPDKKDINGNWGASIYYDGERLNVFMSGRNAKKSGSDKGRIYYAHWRD